VSDTRPPLTTTTSLWPAAVVGLVAVVMLATFLVVDIATSQHVAPSRSSAPVVVGGLGVDRSPAAGTAYCRQPLEVPRDLYSAFVFPLGTTLRPGSNTPNLGAGDFDCYEHLATSAATSGQILGFYRAHLEALGWSLFSTADAPNGHPEYLFQKASSDGFYWVLGISVTATPGSGARWTFTLYQNSQTV
jgi:hypothetical protein